MLDKGTKTKINTLIGHRYYRDVSAVLPIYISIKDLQTQALFGWQARKTQRDLHRSDSKGKG